MSSRIHIGTKADGSPLDFPLDIATESAAIIARKGAGKTYTGRVLAEGLIANNVQIAIVDPLDVWWGLRLSADGKSDGCNVVIFGGSHADLPLTETSGRVLADVVVDRGISAILVLDDLSLAAQRRFMADFGEQLFERKREQQHRTPIHVIIDEADSFAPQRMPPEATRCAGVVDRMVRRGRSRGIGTTAISQRPAVLSKDVLTQTEVLIALQVTAPQDRDALTEWIKANADAKSEKEFLNSLAGLKRGQAWIWSPSRLQIFERVDIRKATTYDSSYTPKVGENRPVTRRLRPVDIDALKEKLSAIIQESDKTNPTVLRKKIADLEVKLANAGAPQNKIFPTITQADVESARADAANACKEKFSTSLKNIKTVMLSSVDQLMEDIDRVISECETKSIPPRQIVKPAVTLQAQKNVTSSRKSLSRYSSSATAVKLPKCEGRILKTLAQYQHEGRTKVQIALITGYACNSGGFANSCSRLKTLGYANADGDLFKITHLGMENVGEFERLPEGKALLNFWTNKLPKAERAILAVVHAAYPNSIDRTNVAYGTGYEASGGGFANALSRLRTLELISGKNELKINPLLVGE